MRLAIFLLFCVGLAAAVPLHSSDLDDLDEFMLQSEGGGRIGERLKEHFENIIERIKKAFEDGKGVRGDLWKKAQDVYEKLKNLGVELSDKIKSTFEELKNKMGNNAPTSSNADFSNLRDMFRRLKELIKEKLDSEELKAKVEKIFGKGSELAEQIINMLREKGEKGKNKILDWIDRIIPDKEERSISEDDLDEFLLQSEGGGRIGERLKEHFENIIERIKKAFEDGKGVRADLWKKAQDVYEKLKNLGVELSDKIKSTFEELKNKMGNNAPTSSNADFSNLRDMFRRLKELIKEKLDSEELKAKVEKIFGRGSELAEQIINILREKGEKGKNKILDWIDRIIPDKEERSISEVFGKLKEFFRDLQLDLKERFTRFGEWVKEKYEQGLERGKTRAENIKRIAKEFIEDTKVIGKDMAEEAREFFREYREDLGQLYDDVVEKVREIIKS